MFKKKANQLQDKMPIGFEPTLRSNGTEIHF